MKLATYKIKVVLRDGRVVQGTTEWDGLASVHPILTEFGEYEYASCIDNILEFQRVN